MMLHLTNKDYETVEAKLQSVESITSAPIHVHFAHHSKKDAKLSAIKFFRHAALTHVINKNAVLIFVAKASGRFSIIGDQGAHEKLPDGFWDQCQLMLTDYFKQSLFVDGIVAVIDKIAHALADSFPPNHDGGVAS